VFDLVILDCDGVLVDSERLTVPIQARVLGLMGWPLTEHEVIERFVGRSQAHLTEELGKRLGRALPVDWEAPYHDLYRRSWDEMEAVPGIADALKRMTCPTCVASSGSHAKMRITLARVGLYDRFEGRIFSGSEVENGKPAPDLFLHAARAMGVAPGRCAVVEDSVWGVQAALAAGMAAYAYAGGVTSAQELSLPGVVVFDDMADLPRLLAAAGG
jgi:HAD superfamily hydrolase (TIGR01509 family)